MNIASGDRSATLSALHHPRVPCGTSSVSAHPFPYINQGYSAESARQSTNLPVVVDFMRDVLTDTGTHDRRYAPRSRHPPRRRCAASSTRDGGVRSVAANSRSGRGRRQRRVLALASLPDDARRQGSRGATRPPPRRSLIDAAVRPDEPRHRRGSSASTADPRGGASASGSSATRGAGTQCQWRRYRECEHHRRPRFADHTDQFPRRHPAGRPPRARR